MSLRDIILAAPDLKRERVEVPEWLTPEGGPVVLWVFEMHSPRRSEWRGLAFDADDKVIETNQRSRLLVHTVCDEAGNPIFKVEDIDALEIKSPAVLNRLFEISLRLNRLGASEQDDAEKN